MNIPGISKEELEAARKIAEEDMRNDKVKSKNKRSRRASKKAQKSK